jgi:hypothetical protein
MTHVSQDQETSVWHSQFSYDSDACDVDLIVPVAAANYDDLIPMADGILYFLNPNSVDQVELFKELINIIQNVRRDIPTVIIFRDRENLIRFSSNQLLEWVWATYPYEAFISDYGSEIILREILYELVQCIMKGQTMINYDTAWLQIPFLIRSVNNAIAQNDWTGAARLADRLSKIVTRFDLADKYIYSEQTAVLYSQAKNFLAAAEAIKHFNPLEANFRRYYVDFLMEEGQSLLNERKFVDAAHKFEFAGNWAGMELGDMDLKQTAIAKAMEAWIGACEVQNAFALVDQFEITEMKPILERLTEKIAKSADYLCSIHEEDLAKTQLYLSFDRYQRAGLFDSIKVLASKVVKVLMIIFDQHLTEGDMHAAKYSLDELTNIWENYGIKAESIDAHLAKLVRMFIKAHDYQKVDSILPKVQSLELKHQLTEELQDEEEKQKNQLKQAELDDITDGLKILFEYVKEEAMQLYQMNIKVFNQADTLTAKRDFQQAANLVRRQADWLKAIGHQKLSFDVLEYALQIYITADFIPRFFSEVQILPEEQRRKFLISQVANLLASFDRIAATITFPEFENSVTGAIRLYRNHLLYEDSRKFAMVLIRYLIHQGESLDMKHNSANVLKCIDITQKIEQIAGAYLDGKCPSLDSLFTRLVEHYIDLGDFQTARQYNARIEDKVRVKQYHQKMTDIEAKQSGDQALRAKKDQESKISAEKLSQLQNFARDQRLAHDNMLRMRNSLKKRYFQSPIDAIIRNDLDKAVDLYSEASRDLIKTRKYELAAITVSMAELVALLLRNVPKIKEIREQTDALLGVSTKIFHDTFPIRVMDFVMEMLDANLIPNMKQGLRIFEHVALFPEEKLVLEALIGKPTDFDALIGSFRKSIETTEKDLPSNFRVLIGKIVVDPALYSKRAAFESKFWVDCNDDVASQNYESASQKYLNSVNELLNRNLEHLSRTSVIMGMLCLLKVKNAQEVQKELERILFKESKRVPNYDSAPEFKLMNIFLDFYEKTTKSEEITEMANAFINLLPLLDWEKSFISGLILRKDGSGESKSETRTVSLANGCTEIDDTLVSQQIVVLSQQLASMKSEFDDMLRKRELGKRTYFTEIFSDLSSDNYTSAAEKYFNLAKRMARRDDFEQAGLMIFLASLCLIKLNRPFLEIKNQIENVLNSLGLVKKILEETFGIKTSLLFLDALKISDPSIGSCIQSIIHKMPLLAEEQKLTF